MDAVARWRARERADLFNEVGTRRGLANAIVEKDFWVCWTLKRLFAPGAPFPRLVFKGGTSLSKGYGAIQRFSEDIDLSFDRAGLGFTGDKDPDQAPSNKKVKERIEELERGVQTYIAGGFVVALTAEVGEQLGPPGPTWELTPDRDDPQTINFQYPSSLVDRDYSHLTYVNPVVRLELGARGDPWPAERRTIRSYAAEEVPEVFGSPECEVEVLAIERTFWEKVTILHSEHYRPEDKATGARMSRHYYDLARLTKGGHAEAALARLDLLETVARHKERYFRSGWSRYDLARPGTLRLRPLNARIGDLAADYEKMRPMFFEAPPSFETVLALLGELEDRINSGVAPAVLEG